MMASNNIVKKIGEQNGWEKNDYNGGIFIITNIKF